MSSYTQLLVDCLRGTDAQADRRLFVTAVFDVVRHRPEAAADWARVTQELGLPRPARLGSAVLDFAAFQAIFQRQRLASSAPSSARPSTAQLRDELQARGSELAMMALRHEAGREFAWQLLDIVLEELPVQPPLALRATTVLTELARDSAHEDDELAADMARMLQAAAADPSTGSREEKRLRLRLQPETWLTLPFDPALQQRFRDLEGWQKLPPVVLGHFLRARGEAFLLEGQLEAAALNLAPAWIIFLLRGDLDRAGATAWRQAQALAWNGTTRVAIDVGERAMQLLAPRWTAKYSQHVLWLARWYLASAQPLEAERWLASLPRGKASTDPLLAVIRGLVELVNGQTDDLGSWPEEALSRDASVPYEAWLRLLAADQLAWRRRFPEASQQLGRLSSPWPEGTAPAQRHWHQLQDVVAAGAWDPRLAQELMRDLERWSLLPALPWRDCGDDVAESEMQRVP